jgi:hypothetical protein
MNMLDIGENKMNRNELKKCKKTLDNGKTWECFCNDEGMIKSFVSKAYDGLDFDGNFELHQIKTPFGQMISVRKK